MTNKQANPSFGWQTVLSIQWNEKHDEDTKWHGEHNKWNNSVHSQPEVMACTLLTQGSGLVQRGGGGGGGGRHRIWRIKKRQDREEEVGRGGDWGQGGGWRRKRVQSLNELSIIQVRHGSQRNVKLSSLEGTRIYSKSLSTNNIAHADSAAINTHTHTHTHKCHQIY